MAKRDLSFEPSVMNAAGTLGFYPDPHNSIEWNQFGAFVTNPISLAVRTPSHGERLISFPGGFLLHTGYPNPGFPQVLRRYSAHWGRSPLLVIVHLLAREPGELATMIQRLETVDGVAGIELGVDSDASPGMVNAFIQAASGELPLIVRLPLERALELAPTAIQTGAMAVSLAPPRGMVSLHGGESIQGRLYGPSIFPTALRVVHALVQLGIPTIGAGGVYSQDLCRAMLAEGVLAVQLDAVLWRAGGYRVLT